MSNNETLFGSVDDLLNASMDDIDDLPPMGVPPTGHYNLDATIEKTTIGDDNREVIVAKFVIDEVNELKEGEDASEAAVGQQFTMYYHVLKKDGTPNMYGIGQLKELLKPFAQHFGKTVVSDIIADVKNVKIAATIKRKVDRRNEDQYKVQIKDVTVL